MYGKRARMFLKGFFSFSLFIVTIASTIATGYCRDLDEVKKEGVIRHLGVPYANFVTGSGDGMDVELVQLFAKFLGVRYEYVATSWERAIPDLTGRNVKPNGDTAELLDTVPTKGDIIANGFTILPWRKAVLDFSQPTFPTQVVLIATATSKLKPIKPSGDMNRDIALTKKLTKGKTCLGVKNTCLDPDLYNLKESGAKVKEFSGSLGDLSVAVIKGESETAVMEMPDALLALKKHPGKIKIIGPLSHLQEMGAGFAKDSLKLRTEFNRFLSLCKRDGTYLRLAQKYYPSAPNLLPAFFK